MTGKVSEAKATKGERKNAFFYQVRCHKRTTQKTEVMFDVQKPNQSLNEHRVMSQVLRKTKETLNGQEYSKRV